MPDIDNRLDEIFSRSGWKYSKPKNTFRGWWKKSRPSFMQNQMTEAEMRNLKTALLKLIKEERIEAVEKYKREVMKYPRTKVNEVNRQRNADKKAKQEAWLRKANQ